MPSMVHVKVLVAQSCPTLCNPTDWSPAGASVHRVLQASMLERITISISRPSPRHGMNPGLLHWRQTITI